MGKPTKRSVFICLSLSFLLLLFTTQLSAEEVKAPRIKIASPIHEFGSVTQGTKVTHEFSFTNKGNADLQIQKVAPSCGCTASTVDKDVIAPGEEGKIQVTFDTTGFTGSKTKTVRVYTNDIDSPVVMLSVKGNVEQEVVVEPRRVFYGEVVKGINPGGVQREVTVRVKDDAKVKLGQIRSYSKHLEIKELSSSDKKKKLLVTLHPEVPVGEFRDRVIISVSGAKRKAINIPVFASVKGNLRVDPRTLSFGILEGQKPLERTVRVENLGPSAVKVTGVKSSDKNVNVDFKPLKKGKLYQIKVTIDPNKVKKDLRASVTVSTDSQDDKTISFNVYGIMPPKG